MFEESDVCVGDLLGVIAIKKIKYDFTGQLDATLIEEDSLAELYYDSFEDVAQECDFGSVEMFDEYVYKLCFPNMREYYNLCREYGKKCKVAFKHNQFVKEAKRFVDREMNNIDSYCINWLLFHPKSETLKHWPCLTIFLSAEFYQYVQLVNALYSIRFFYEEGVKNLKKEIACIDNKIIALPIQFSEKERSQAA